MITVPAGSTLTLRCPGDEPLALIALDETRATFVSELPPIPVLSLDGPGTRRTGILELVSSKGVTWVEAELRGPLLTILGDMPTGMVQRRAAPRRPGAYAAAGTAQLDADPQPRLVAITGQVEDISVDGLLLRTGAGPRRILRSMLHVDMPWGALTAAVTTVDQRSDLLRGTFEWIDPAGAAALRDFCA